MRGLNGLEAPLKILACEELDKHVLTASDKLISKSAEKGLSKVAFQRHTRTLQIERGGLRVTRAWVGYFQLMLGSCP